MIDYFQGADDDFYYQVKGENGEVLVTSEGYTSEADAKRGFEALKRAVAATAFAPGWPGGIQTLTMLPGAIARVESGPVQFGDDWPGLFLRGDSCFAYALALKAERSQSGDAFSRAGVDGLITALESTNVHKS